MTDRVSTGPDRTGRVLVEASLVPLTGEQRPVIERLWQLYTHDMSQFRGSMPDADGRFPADRLPTYFEDADRGGYLVRADAGTGPAPAGFALVRGLADGPAVMGDFFVVRALRRQGVGREVARHVLARHPGRWEIPFQESNPGAARFWREVATAVAGDAWLEETRPVPGKPQATPDTWLLLTA